MGIQPGGARLDAHFFLLRHFQLVPVDQVLVGDRHEFE
jgi:hypothetical protein